MSYDSRIGNHPTSGFRSGQVATTVSAGADGNDLILAQAQEMLANCALLISEIAEAAKSVRKSNMADKIAVLLSEPLRSGRFVKFGAAVLPGYVKVALMRIPSIRKRSRDVALRLKAMGFQKVFIGKLHGRGGEDGTHRECLNCSACLMYR